MVEQRLDGPVLAARRLVGKVVLVTGGASGIGAACAARLAREGASVVVGDLKVAPDDVGSIEMDVADPAQVGAGIARLLERHGRLDGLVHSAGIARTGSFLDTAIGDFDRIIEVNLRGTFIACQAAARAMVGSGGGAIVNIASVSGMIGNGRRSVYGASKAAVIHLTKVMAVELARHRIRANAVSPGPITTPLVDGFYTEAVRREWTDRVPMGRFGTPDEVAPIAAFLCSDDATYITGQTIAADGGFVVAGLADDAG